MNKIQAAQGIYDYVVDNYISDNNLNPESKRAMTQAQEMACGVLKNNYIYGRGWLRMAEIGAVAGIQQNALRFRLTKFEEGMMCINYASQACKLWKGAAHDFITG